jgi:hypothetical protein
VEPVFVLVRRGGTSPPATGDAFSILGVYQDERQAGTKAQLLNGVARDGEFYYYARADFIDPRQEP